MYIGKYIPVEFTGVHKLINLDLALWDLQLLSPDADLWSWRCGTEYQGHPWEGLGVWGRFGGVMKWIKSGPRFFHVFFFWGKLKTLLKIDGLEFEQEGFITFITHLFWGGSICDTNPMVILEGILPAKKTVHGVWVKLRGVQESPGPEILRLELKTNRNWKTKSCVRLALRYPEVEQPGQPANLHIFKLNSTYFFTVLAPEIGFLVVLRRTTTATTTTKSMDAGPFFLIAFRSFPYRLCQWFMVHGSQKAAYHPLGM